MERRPERISSLNVERGLYVLRYVSSSASETPVIFVRASPGDEANVSLIPFPGDAAGRLTTVGSLLVIMAMQTATLQVTAQAVSVAGSLNAELQVEPLKPGVAAPVAAEVQPQVAVARGADLDRPAPEPVAARATAETAAGSPDADDMKVLAHVARRGDVVVSEGVWIAGPDAPAPLEGIAVKFPAAVGELRYQVLATGESRWSDWMPSGMFGGSRGRAKTLVGVRLQLVPAAGSSATLEGEALFLGSAVVRKDGLEMEFRSAAGFDPLLGLRLEIKRETAAAEPRSNTVPDVPPSGRVRVFRATGRRSG